MTTMLETRALTGGVDTHSEIHVAAVIDHLGGVVGVESFPVDRSGYAVLTNWMTSFGEIGLVGVEGTGSYGAGLARHLARAGVAVVEVDRPNRQERARAGKTVCRLKGGDPFVFGRGGEEAEACHAAGVQFEIIPGVTSAIAAPAYIGRRNRNSPFKKE